MWYNTSKSTNIRYKERSIKEVSNNTNNKPHNIRSYIWLG